MTQPKKKPATKAPKSRPPKQGIRLGVERVYREAILEAAERLFGRGGFEGTKMTDIAKESGLAAGTLYNYFESKEQIFQQLVNWRCEAMLKKIGAIAKTQDGSEQALRALVTGMFEQLEEQRDMFGIFLQLGLHCDWEVRRVCGPQADHRHDEFQAMFTLCVQRACDAGLLRDDLSTEDLVTILTGSMNGFVSAWARGGSKGPLSDRAELVVDAFLKGAGRRVRGK